MFVVELIDAPSEQQVGDELREVERLPSEEEGDNPDDNHPGSADHASLQCRLLLGQAHSEVVEGTDAGSRHQHCEHQLFVAADEQAGVDYIRIDWALEQGKEDQSAA